jgi:hypothetical protein
VGFNFKSYFPATKWLKKQAGPFELLHSRIIPDDNVPLRDGVEPAVVLAKTPRSVGLPREHDGGSVRST